MKKYRSAILRAEVRPLPVQLRRVVSLPESIEQLFVTHFCRIERYLDHFRVSGSIGANIFVGRIRGFPAAVANRSVDHSRNSLERRLHAPEASCSKRRYLCHGFHLLIQTLIISYAHHLDARAVASDSLPH